MDSLSLWRTALFSAPDDHAYVNHIWLVRSCLDISSDLSLHWLRFFPSLPLLSEPWSTSVGEQKREKRNKTSESPWAVPHSLHVGVYGNQKSWGYNVFKQGLHWQAARLLAPRYNYTTSTTMSFRPIQENISARAGIPQFCHPSAGVRLMWQPCTLGPWACQQLISLWLFLQAAAARVSLQCVIKFRSVQFKEDFSSSFFSDIHWMELLDVKVKSIHKYLQPAYFVVAAGGDCVCYKKKSISWQLMREQPSCLRIYCQRMLFTLNHAFHVFFSTALCLICNLCFHLECRTVKYRMLWDVAAV